MATKERFTVRGAHCENCIATIERTLRRLDGIVHVDAKLQPQALVEVEYDSDKVNRDTLRRAIERVGYELVAE
ncbi:MAG: copper chaperone [Chlorobiota bacterium]|jgi:copper chaperone|nr:MAG: copper chaperone [Chlorobiota bacterium]